MMGEAACREGIGRREFSALSAQFYCEPKTALKIKCMYICMYICVYIYMYVCVCIHTLYFKIIYIFIYVFIYPFNILKNISV